jgi:DNA repair exonuclease SbcCD nuclease subunit
MVKVFHTADIHIGKVFEQFGHFGDQLRAQIKNTFRSLAQLALSERAAAILISGDLFDTSSPSPNDIRFFMETVRAAKPLLVFLLPGTWTHDGFLRNHFYRSNLFLIDRPENLLVFSGEQPETFRLPADSVSIHGRAVLPESGNPLDGMTPDPHTAFNIGMLHAGISLPQLSEDQNEASLTKVQVEQSGMTYLALGHWHAFRRYFDDSKTVVQYPGSPETLQFKDGEQSGFVAVVTLNNGEAVVEQRRVGHYRWMEHDVDCSRIASSASLREKVLALADPERILRVTLRGTLANKDPINLEQMNEELGPKFAYLDLDGSQLDEDLPVGALEKEYRENTVEHTFVTLVEQALDNAKDDAQAALLRESLRRGHKLFQGHEGVSS